MRKSNLWVWFVFAVLIGVLAYGCSIGKPTSTVFGMEPSVDVKNNATGMGSVDQPMSDGIPDPEWLAWKQGVEDRLNGLTGGGFAPVFRLLSEIAGLGALGLATWNKIRGDKDHAESLKLAEENKKEIQLTDINVATVADHANVPQEKLV